MTSNNLDVQRLFEIYTKTKNTIKEDFDSQTNFDHVNPFWRNILSKRENFPSFNDTLSFLSNNSAFGLGKRSEGSFELEQRSYVDATCSIDHAGLEGISSKVSESVIGFPKYFEIDSSLGSTSFTENMVSTSRLIKYIDKYLSKKDKINILEIGAGWGAVLHQLIQYYGDKINKIAICDLHENLFISSFYLQSTFPDRKAIFTPKDSAINGQDSSFIFCSPSRIGNVDIEFDLIFNMISFQEMDIEIIENYLKYIQGHLSPNGIFYSENGVAGINAQNRVQKFSDYKYTKYFDILELENGKRFCPHLFYGNKHEILLSPKNQDEPQNLNNAHLDGLNFIMDTRLDENIQLLRKNTIKGQNTSTEIKMLELINEFFEGNDKKGKKLVLNKIKQVDDGIIYKYLLSLFLIATNDIRKALPLLTSIEPELKGLAKINVLCFIGVLDRSKQAQVLDKIQELHPAMVNTTKSIFRYKSTSKKNIIEKSCRKLHIKVKKWFGYSTYQLFLLPTFLKLKILNRIEKRVLKMKEKNAMPYHLR